MGVIDKLASLLGRNDEEPNVQLAEAIARKGDRKAIAELAEAVRGKDRAIASDALKALYEVGERKPDLIAEHLTVFLDLLSSRNNRLVWGAMCAVDAIAGVDPRSVADALPRIMTAVDKGSVITRDHAVKAMVKLAANKRYAAKVLPLLHELLRTCPVNQLPMYAELVATIESVPHARATSAILSKRLVDVPQPPKRKRIERVLKQLTN